MPVQPQPPRESGPKAERTRTSILEAAEQVFAEKGYAAARLEEVAARAGIRRASIVYYFRNKQDLYDAVLSEIFGELFDRYEYALAARRPLTERIEAVIEAWVDYVAERPAVTRLMMWGAVDGSQERVAAAAERQTAVLSALTTAIEQGQREGLFRPIDPIHFIFTIVGATVFFVAGTHSIARHWPFDPLAPDQLQAHRRQLLSISRRLLGTRGAPTIDSATADDADCSPAA